MRPQAQSPDEHTSCHLSLITCHYVRYALIRCLVFTNEQADAERIAACTLAKSCLLSRRLGGLADPGLLVELAINTVAKERRYLRFEISDSRFEVEDRSTSASQISNFKSQIQQEAQAFLLTAPMCSVAGAINGVGRLARDLLILHYIEGLSPAELGVIHRMPVGRVEVALDDARREFTEVLGSRPEWGDEAVPDVGMMLRQLAGCLDEACVIAVRECVLQYLADCT